MAVKSSRQRKGYNLSLLDNLIFFKQSNICFNFVNPPQQLFSIQDYLECVGRLQDHCDTLEDVRKDLLIKTNLDKTLEELQIQVEECQVRKKCSKLRGCKSQTKV